uniref:Rho-GAP domain-containing protein n=1 Tax=Myripristis murdjan TaxID=586833 RepID=A0A667XZU0_9TELE
MDIFKFGLLSLGCRRIRDTQRLDVVTPYLLTSVPQVLQKCAEFIEQHGIVDGIYRLSGVTSNIQRLRYLVQSELQAPTSTVRLCK